MRRAPESISARQVAAAVASHMLGTSTNAIMRPHRGRPRDAYCRWVAMHVYRNLTDPPRTYAEVGKAFDRDRRTVARGVAVVETHLIPTVTKIMERLTGG